MERQFQSGSEKMLLYQKEIVYGLVKLSLYAMDFLTLNLCDLV
jgi:hypothetical protein